jgi:hypothetical protein
MTYTIKGKPYTEFDIKKRCAELMEVLVLVRQAPMGNYLMLECGFSDYNPCNNWNDAGPIIEKCWDELMFGRSDCLTEWNHLATKHNCTKLTAACICLIELNE